MAIDYKKVGWDTSKFVNPSNMNQMDDGIKAACDGVDALNENIATKNLKTYTSLAQIGCTSANTISEIMAKLPSNAVLDIGVSSTENNLTNSLPVVAAGRLVVTKQYSARGIAIFTRFSNGNTWINPYMDSVFVGWEQFALINDSIKVSKEVTVNISNSVTAYSEIHIGYVADLDSTLTEKTIVGVILTNVSDGNVHCLYNTSGGVKDRVAKDANSVNIKIKFLYI